MPVHTVQDGELWIVTIQRPEARNAVDGPTADELAESFRAFDQHPTARVAILTGAGGTFCAGADLKAISSGTPNRLDVDGDAPMGPSRMRLSKPVIAAIEGYAVAGGLELALWCDLRVAAEDATLGVFCRRFGVPLIDGGTVRLPRLIGLSRALDLILTGRPVHTPEALAMGLVNRSAPKGEALAVARQLASLLCTFPQLCMNTDRSSAYEQSWLPLDAALRREFLGGLEVLTSGESFDGATRFAQGEGRSGSFSSAPSASDSATRDTAPNKAIPPGLAASLREKRPAADERASYEGGCHCGAVRFRVEVDEHCALDCNCSICRKKGFLHLIVPSERFTLLSGAEMLTVYSFGTHTAKHTFCSRCGMHPFYTPRSHPNGVDVNVRCLDGDAIDRFSIEAFNGQRWEDNIDTIR
jgi:enoyl-CoA hydratase